MGEPFHLRQTRCGGTQQVGDLADAVARSGVSSATSFESSASR
jgi:hypothetical protein